ncbi:MAG: PRC-barrel domain-containing protein [Puia sp.]|nr:PRC-barrel domain-containing protein [Puia sp.]
MQRNVNNLIGNNLDATDGEIGKVKDFYFDDQTWTIRYLIVQTGTWLSEREVLISPNVLLKHSWESGLFPVNLTRDQVRSSPAVDTQKPVSRLHEEQLAEHYPWQPYWGSAFIPGQVWGIIPSTPVIDPDLIQEPATIEQTTEDAHLRSCRQVTGYHIHASDGDIGHVDDFIMDDQTWQISYLIVDTRHWIGGKKVLVAVHHVQEVQWENSKVVVDLSVDDIKHGTAIDKWDYIIPEGDRAESQKHSFHLDKTLPMSPR